MKKNIFMRLACVVLVLTLLSTCVISGTFAKYVTTGSGSDTARVAEWGVQIKGLDSDLFAKEYAADSTTDIAMTVVAETEVVAPGTKNAEGTTFSLTGTPEVATRVEFKVTKSDDATKEAVDVVLPAGEDYKDWTVATADGYTGTYDVAADYYPVVFTLKDGATELAKGNLAAIKTFLTSKNDDYAANTDLKTILGGTTGTYTLTWEWAYGEFEGISANDQKDTTLGNIAAGIETIDGASVNLDYAISVVVTQID